MAKLLTIETGFSCNSRCNYCTQLDYRAIPQPERLDLATADIKARIDWAADNGYDQVGFSGGEPTIRPDFIELIAYAKSLDFERIGVTTNGRMFAYPKFAHAAVQAGLDGWTFSLHGPTPEIHDKITASEGSLEQALAGLANVHAACKALGVRPHLMNNQILLPSNTQYIREMVELLGPLGVQLFMIQPFIAQRSNVAELGKFFVPYPQIVAAVERALPALAQFGARIKPYNVPNCLLWPLGREHVEGQFYGITVYREFERETAGEFKAFRAKQWYRIDACKGCKEMCPGFRMEQYPQERMAADLVDTAFSFANSALRQPDDGPLVFAGTELMTPETVGEAMTQLARQHGPVAWMTAAMERATRLQLAELASSCTERGELAELVLVAQPMDQRFLAQRVLEKGSFESLRQLLYHLAELRDKGRSVPRLRLLINVGDALRIGQEPEIAKQWQALCQSLDRARGTAVADLLVAIPNYPRGRRPPDVSRQGDQHRAWAKELADLAQRHNLHARLITLEDRRGLDADRAAAMQLAEQHFATVLPMESWAKRLFRHPLSSPELDFVSWAPPWLFERWDLSHAPLPEGSTPRAYADAADEETFAAVRQVSVAAATGTKAGRGRFGGASRTATPKA